MVGIPGRSKGCITCRRRKKGCDKHVPGCHRCIRAGLVCGGYGQDLVWVNSAPPAASFYDATQTTGAHVMPWTTYTKQSFKIHMQDDLVIAAREQKYLGIFWTNYFPNGRAFGLQACDLSTGGWTGLLDRLYDSEPILRQAILALSASVVAAQNGDAQLKVKGLQTYDSAVEDMSRAIRQQHRSRTDGILAAARLLEIYEGLFSLGGRRGNSAASVANWRGHNDGQLALILLRGPQSFKSEPSHQLFVDARLNIILASFTRRKTCPISHHAWKTIPWEFAGKVPKDTLLDILIDIPGLLEGLDNVRAAIDADKCRRVLLHQCTKMQRALDEWEAEVGKDLETFDFTVAVPLKRPASDRDVALLHLSTLYWSICLLLHNIMGSLVEPYPLNCYDRADPSPAKPPRSFLTTCAHKLAHAVPLLYEPFSGAFGCHAGLFPLAVTIRFLTFTEPGEPSPERQMLTRLFRTQFQGTNAGQFYDNFEREVWRPRAVSRE